MSLDWMYWTVPTAIFFITIFLMIAGMFVWELVSPTIERRGFLQVPTTRGTRFLYWIAGNGLYPPGLARAYGGEPVVGPSLFSGLDIHRDALGIIIDGHRHDRNICR